MNKIIKVILFNLLLVFCIIGLINTNTKINASEEEYVSIAKFEFGEDVKGYNIGSSVDNYQEVNNGITLDITKTGWLSVGNRLDKSCLVCGDEGGKCSISFTIPEYVNKIKFSVIGHNQHSQFKINNGDAINTDYNNYNIVEYIPTTSTVTLSFEFCYVYFDYIEYFTNFDLFKNTNTLSSVRFNVNEDVASDQAIRFGIKIDKDYFNVLKQFEIGIKVSYVNDTKTYSKTLIFEESQFARVDSNGNKDDNGDYYQVALVVNKLSDIERDFTGVAFIKVNDKYFYNISKTMSFNDIIKEYKNNLYETLTDDQKNAVDVAYGKIGK